MADAEHSKCFVRKDVWVQVPHPAHVLATFGVGLCRASVGITNQVYAQIVR